MRVSKVDHQMGTFLQFLMSSHLPTLVISQGLTQCLGKRAQVSGEAFQPRICGGTPPCPRLTLQATFDPLRDLYVQRLVLRLEQAGCRRYANGSSGSDDVICYPLLNDCNQSFCDHAHHLPRATASIPAALTTAVSRTHFAPPWPQPFSAPRARPAACPG